MKRYNKKTIKAWLLYDWANSVYSLVITATLFPIYYGNIAQKANYWGINTDALYSYAIGLSFIIVVLISPVLSALADMLGRRKWFLYFFSIMGSSSCIGLSFFINEDTLDLGLIMSILASVGFWGSLVFYNAYLPHIAPRRLHDDLSALGFSYGYFGGLVLMILSIAFILLAPQLGILDNEVHRYCFIGVGIWWFGFSQYSLYYLPKDAKYKWQFDTKILIKDSFKKMFQAQKKLFKTTKTKVFLISFFCYSVGVQTLFYLAVPFGKNSLKIPSMNLIYTILAMQLIAIFGANFYAKLSDKKGNKVALQVAILFWLVACIIGALIKPGSAYAPIIFYTLAGLIALVMGGIQSLSRSTYSKLIDQEPDQTLCFSFYDITEKLAIIIGTFTVGAVIQQFGNYNLGILSLSIFFMISYFYIKKYKD